MKSSKNSEEYKRIYAALKSRKEYPELLSEGAKGNSLYIVGALLTIITWLLLFFVPFYKAEVAEGALVSNFSLCDVFTTPMLEVNSTPYFLLALSFFMAIMGILLVGTNLAKNYGFDKLVESYFFDKRQFTMTAFQQINKKSTLMTGAMSVMLLSFCSFVLYGFAALLLNNVKPESLEELDQINLMTFCNGVNGLIFLPITSCICAFAFSCLGEPHDENFLIKATEAVMSAIEETEVQAVEAPTAAAETTTEPAPSAQQETPPPEDKQSGEQ